MVVNYVVCFSAC